MLDMHCSKTVSRFSLLSYDDISLYNIVKTCSRKRKENLLTLLPPRDSLEDPKFSSCPAFCQLDRDLSPKGQNRVFALL